MTQPRRPSTIVAAARPDRDPAYGSVAPPLWPSDTFRWSDADSKPDYDYSRTVNPNRDLLTEALAELEGAAGGVVTGSGQAAALLALLLLPVGGCVVAPHDCYGGTYRLLKALEEQGKLHAEFIDMLDDEAVDRALEDRTDLLWIETPSNPLLRITDIGRRAAAGKNAGALVIADNTLLTPLRQKPLELGCDLVMHSTTKVLNGHGDLYGGALLAADPALVEKLQWWSNAAGLNGSAYDAAQTLRGLRTLPLRVDRQEASAKSVAEWLASHPGVSELNYPDVGFMISFRLKRGAQATARFLARLELITLASSLGGFATLICKPATMTHRGMPPEAQEEAGIHPDLLRLSIGLEDPDDVISDLARGFGEV